jgi:glycosyltransferase involved in cell wall biosynthesis
MARVESIRRTRTPRRILLFVVPRDANPYQELLYAPMRASHPQEFQTLYWRRRPWLGLPSFFLLAVWAAARGSRLVHVHWLAWDVRVDIPMRKRLSGAVSRAALWWLKVLRFHIVWTVHNVVPHEEQTNDDHRVGLRLAQEADAIIAHSAVIADSLSESGFPTQSAVVIPQGSYVGLYGPEPDPGEARETLKLPSPGRVLLFFGLIRAYKGVPELLEAWNNLDLGGSLFIAGSCPDDRLSVLIKEAAEKDPSINVDLHFIPDQEVARYFAAADGVCLPFRRVTTSSSALLALSLGRPLIAPRLGALEDLPEDVGFFYGGDTGQTLSDALLSFFGTSEEELAMRARNGRAYADALSWSTISESTYSLYTRILEDRPT